jgi:fatty-acyl-CoA synthase
VLNECVGSWIARRARRTPERVAVIHDGASVSYANLDRRVTRLAEALTGLGVRVGDRVAFLAPNHPAFLETMFAAGTIGAIFVPVNTRLAGPEVAAQLADCGARTLVYGPSHVGLLAGIRHELGLRDIVALAEPGPGEHGYEDLIASGSDQPVVAAVTADDPFVIIYTSGTTGKAKGATLSHGNLTWNSINVVIDSDVRADEVALVVAPLFHSAALGMLSLPTILMGGALVIEPGFEPGRALDLIERHRVTSMFGVPAVYDALAYHERFATADLSSLRTLLCGGAPVPASTIRTYTERGLTFIQGYGLTEAAPGALLLDAAHARTKAGSAGIPHFFTEVRVVRPDLTEAAPGEAGEIVIAGPNIMTGYWQQPEATALAVTGDGWLRSGDVGVADEDGYITVADRIKDLIISGGENIYPAEVESALADHPAVAECGVIGVPDGRWGEVGRAIVVLRPGAQATEEELLGFLDGRLARYKIPRSAVFVAQLPRSATGKILKKQLRGTYGT